MIQDDYIEIGQNGCYYFCLCDIANEFNEKNSNCGIKSKIESYFDCWKYCKEKGWIGKDCYIKDPCSILNYMTGHKWSVKWEEWNYVPKENEYQVEEWRWGLSQHFARIKQRNYNPLNYSRCVDIGQITSQRIYKVVL